MNEHVQKAKKIISENIYCVIATSSLDSRPWISPVFFAYDSKFNLYWISNKDAHHSDLVRKNQNIAIVIFNSRAPEGEGDGVYFEAVAKELYDDAEIAQAVMILNQRVSKEEFRVRDVSKVRGDGIWRIYRATPVRISKLTDGELINGQYVDRRIEIRLD